MGSDYLVAPRRHVAEGFVLRGYQPGDGPHLAEAKNSSYEHLKRFMDWAVPHESIERSEERCRQLNGQWLLATDFVMGIWSSDESRVLGGAGFHLREGPLELLNAEVGMWIREDVAGRGLGSAALCAILRWGFSEWPWLRLSWRCSSANVASQRTAEKAGLAREGVLRSHAMDPDGSRRDTVCYAALRDEWVDPGLAFVG